VLLGVIISVYCVAIGMGMGVQASEVEKNICK